jgi:hypothetical protein
MAANASTTDARRRARPAPALNAANDEELVEIFLAFNLTITYDKPGQRLHLAATITPELLPESPNNSDRPEGRSQINGIAGAGLKPNPATVDGSQTKALVHRVEESCLLV